LCRSLGIAVISFVLLPTFSCDSSMFNEAHHARRVASFLGTNHHEEIINPDPALVVEKIAHILDQPFADSSAVPT
jgi:asparagine synthase (glutamine-hydrolysing)